MRHGVLRPNRRKLFPHRHGVRQVGPTAASQPPERQKLVNGVNASYQEFVKRVAEGRHRKAGDIASLAEGRVWLGSQAKSRGLVDELGGLDRAFDLVKQKAGIPAAEKTSVVIYPARRSILEVLLSRSTEEALMARLGLGGAPERLRSVFRDSQINVWLRGGMLQMMPYSIQVR